MPEKPLTIATYAAGASLAAATLVYVFAPTFFIDGDANGNVSSKKRGAIGLVNVANDCFINSVLQALAGLGDLRLYLIRETHRRTLDGIEAYKELVEDPARKGMPLWKIDGLQRGIVTQGLKDVLDALNERPLYKKTISANDFVKVLETAFRQRISRQQQDAQEFLQVVAERLCDEYHAGQRARKHARSSIAPQPTHSATEQIDEAKLERTLSKFAQQQMGTVVQDDEHGQPAISKDVAESTPESLPSTVTVGVGNNNSLEEDEPEEGFPFEGTSESQIECLTCGFKPKASSSTFCSLTLNVPQVTSTSLNACFDGMFKTEYIEDFKCEKCRLQHAVEILENEAERSNNDDSKQKAIKEIEKLRKAIETDPEDPPEDVQLPDSKLAPKRKIARHQRIVKFPKIMAIHLSRSIFDVGRSSMKNSAKVAFPERLPLGGLREQKKYKLLGVVTHKGSHHSGHYESFRRQNIYAPFSNSNVFDKSGVYSKAGTPNLSTISTPQIGATKTAAATGSTPSPPDLLSLASDSPSSSKDSLVETPQRVSMDSLSLRQHGTNARLQAPTSAPRDPETSSIRSVARSARSAISKVPTNLSTSLSRSSTPKTPTFPTTETNTSSTETGTATLATTNGTASKVTMPRRKKKVLDKWWRISDEKVKESKTGEVLGMQKEVYLLFYEMERDGDES